jgi:hypothetical protein
MGIGVNSDPFQWITPLPQNQMSLLLNAKTDWIGL